MKTLVTGATGQVGHALLEFLRNCDYEVYGVSSKNFDLTDEENINSCVNKIKPNLIIHCGAYTAVDAAEDNQELCHKINVIGTEKIVAVCKKLGCVLAFLSSDYVFSGEGERFQTEEDPKIPLNVYGKSKLDAENWIKKELKKYFIIRTSWVYGNYGTNFYKTMLKLGETRKKINVVDDQIGSPTYVSDLVDAIYQIIQTDKYGVYNVTNEDVCSWAEFAQEIFNKTHMDVVVNRITSEEYNSKAKRPLNSRLSKGKLIESGFEKLPKWRDALDRCINLRK